MERRDFHIIRFSLEENEHEDEWDAVLDRDCHFFKKLPFFIERRMFYL